jgi:ribosome maturation factor RimP
MYLFFFLTISDHHHHHQQNNFVSTTNRDRGPVIQVQAPELPLYHDPDLREPLPVNMDDDQDSYVLETDEEREDALIRRTAMYAPIDPDMGDDPNEPHIPDIGMDNTVGQVTKTPQAELADDQFMGEPDLERSPDATIAVNTQALSTIGQAILDALEPFEDEWQILSRHELILTSPSSCLEVIETQKQFDAYRDHHVAVQTYDPLGSNRTLKGQLVDRNAMDLLLNIKGRLVTVPLNFVRCVQLPPQGYDDDDSSPNREYMEDEEDEMEGDVEMIEAATTSGDARLMP